MAKVILILALLSLALSGELSAQLVRIDSGSLDRIDRIHRIRETVFTLNGYISDMVGECQNQDRTACNQIRNRCKQAALTLFVGRGESYEVDGIRKEPVKMETTFISTNGSKSTRSQFMKVYFQKLIGLATNEPPKYIKVTITSCEVVEISVGSIRQIDDNLYECTAVFGIQLLTDRTDDSDSQQPQYIECSIKCDIGFSEKGKEFVVLLGDTKCFEYHRM